MLGGKISNYLKSNGIKQAFLAERTGMTQNQISDICIHDRKIDAVEYFKICNALNLPLDYFFEVTK